MARSIEIEIEPKEEMVQDHVPLAQRLCAEANWVSGRYYFNYVIRKCRQAAKRGDKMIVVEGMDSETEALLVGEGFAVHMVDLPDVYVISFK